MPLVQFVRELYENPLNAMSCLENQDRKSLKAEHFWKQKNGSKRREISHFTCPDSLKYGDFASFWPTCNFLEKLNYHVGVYRGLHLFLPVYPFQNLLQSSFRKVTRCLKQASTCPLVSAFFLATFMTIARVSFSKFLWYSASTFTENNQNNLQSLQSAILKDFLFENAKKMIHSLSH